MTMTKNRHRQADLYKDVEKIKAAIAATMDDIRGIAGQALRDSLANIRDKSTAVKDNVSDYTAKQPIKSLGISLLCGLIIGYLLHK